MRPDVVIGVTGIVVATYSVLSPELLGTPAEVGVLVASAGTSVLLLVAAARDQQAKDSRRGA